MSWVIVVFLGSDCRTETPPAGLQSAPSNQNGSLVWDEHMNSVVVLMTRCSSSDLLPLDLLTRALPRPGQAPPTQMVQSRGSRGFRLAGAEATALSFPASQIFTNCDYFPSEFSLVATVKIPNLRQKVNATEPGLVLFVTLGTRPPCSSAEQGQLWFDAQSRGLFICDGPAWTTLLQSTERLDYLEDYQDLYTRSETFDVEVFSIPSEGLFMAAANRDSRPGSGIYRWTDGTFQLYQNISTQEARAWKHFTIDDQVGNTSGRAVDWEFFTVGEEKFLVVANSHDGSSYSLNSVIYRCVESPGQVLPTFGCRDWEHFRTEQGRFLLYSINDGCVSVSSLFEVNQTLSTSGAYDWEFFSVGPYHFLAVANTFDGRTTAISSTIYVWLDGCFQVFQNIPVSVSALSSAVHKQ
uniref:Thrombospondin-type laminin G domain and EAR repeats b n=1 Tax=Stegastes partitus TaxID=144197 RepID=A0A3B5BBB5_9TELE